MPWSGLLSLALLAAVIAASPAMSPAMAETMSFENATAILAESCGKDIDTNCAGVNLDAPRLKECLTRNQDSVSAQCRADYIRAFDAIQKRVPRASPSASSASVKSRRCARRRRTSPARPSPAWSRCRAEPGLRLHQGARRRGVSLMPPRSRAALPSVAGRRLLDGHLAGARLAWSQEAVDVGGHGQRLFPAFKPLPIWKLPALRQQAADRIKTGGCDRAQAPAAFPGAAQAAARSTSIFSSTRIRPSSGRNPIARSRASRTRSPVRR